MIVYLDSDTESGTRTIRRIIAGKVRAEDEVAARRATEDSIAHEYPFPFSRDLSGIEIWPA
ncbi:MAG: hypothetical protein M3R24_33785 [Chloroflexota bacterium]|nr:hypothetical protein [Chloroflexota bacterium]